VLLALFGLPAAATRPERAPGALPGDLFHPLLSAPAARVLPADAHAKDRGRGVARGNIREIVQASFGYAFLIYAIGGGLLYLIWRTANAG